MSISSDKAAATLAFLQRVQDYKLVGTCVHRVVDFYNVHTPSTLKTVGSKVIQAAEPVAQRFGLPPITQCVEQLDQIGCQTLDRVEERFHQIEARLHEIEARICTPAIEAYSAVLLHTEAVIDRVLPPVTDDIHPEAATEATVQADEDSQDEHEDEGVHADEQLSTRAQSDPSPAVSLARIAALVRHRITARTAARAHQIKHAFAHFEPHYDALTHAVTFASQQMQQTLAPARAVASQVEAAVPKSIPEAKAAAKDAIDRIQLQKRLQDAIAYARARAAPFTVLSAFVPPHVLEASEKLIALLMSNVDGARKNAETRYDAYLQVLMNARAAAVDYTRPYEAYVPIDQTVAALQKTRERALSIVASYASALQGIASQYGIQIWVPVATPTGAAQ
eukprot:TRINITY_DN3089_c0_g1_i1.p1 TRINITY_DN3089_c0_g1~~TRINITY_DN3089_c0_g1_i1.p1  ORF type:complete len:393 (-),score=95.21 TRINITY_DN3089_c0_g1_i1:328-1506(-)